MYKMVEEHDVDGNHSYEEYEDYDEYEIVYDLKEKILAPLNIKLLKKVEEKKWLFDKLFSAWLAVLELKKKFLFQLWLKKQGKKKKDNGDEHYEFFIPYYTSTYKPHHHTSGYDEHYHVSSEHYEAHQHNVADDYLEDENNKSFDHVQVIESPYQVNENHNDDQDGVLPIHEGEVGKDLYFVPEESSTYSITKIVDEKPDDSKSNDFNAKPMGPTGVSSESDLLASSDSTIKQQPNDSSSVWSSLQRMFK